MRLNGTVIWADPRNPITTKTQVPFDIANFTDFAPPTTSFTMSFACLLCRGPITQVSKIRAGDRVIYDVNASPQSSYTIRIYLGDEVQMPDPLIVASAGATTPAYRGDAYVVFQDLPLVDFNNAFPNPLSFDVVKADSGLLASDSFNRADGTLITADSGQTWQFGTVAGQVVSNQANTTGSNDHPTWIDCSVSDATFAQLTVTTGTGSGLGAGFVLGRLSDKDNYWWFGQSAFDSSNYELGKRVAGAFTIVTTSTQPALAGDVLKLTFNGATVTGYVNGLQVCTASDSFNQTATSYGFSCASTNRIDDFSAGLLVATQVALSTILTDLFTQAGLTAGQFDVSAAVDKVDGFIIADRSDARSVIDPLLQAYDTYLTEVDGKIFALKRGAGSVATIPAGDLAARLVDGPESDPPLTLTIPRLSELDLPFRAELTYYGLPARNYLQSMQGASRVTKTWLQQVVTVTVPLVLSDDHARQIVEKILYRRWLERETPQIVLGPRYLYLAPGDTVLLPTPAGSLSVRIQQMDLALPGPIRITGVLDDAAVLVQSAAGGALTTPPAAVMDTLTTTLVAWSGNALRDADAASIGFYAVANAGASGYWPGAALYLSLDAGASYQLIGSINSGPAIGTALSALAAGTEPGPFDTTNTVDISLIAGDAPTSTSDADVTAGANLAILGDEVIQFATVTPLTGTTYRLSRLLRGRRGTDGRWSEHRVGERFALLDASAVREVLGGGAFSSQVILKAVTSGTAIAAATPVPLSIRGEEAKPYAPCHLAATRLAGDITLTWTRRSRTGAGLPSGATVPLGETTEAYAVSVLSGAPKTITAIMTASVPTFNSTAHGFSNGQKVYLTGVIGLVGVNGLIGTVSNALSNSFSLSDVSTLYLLPAYVSGGTAERVLRTFTPTSPSQVYLASAQTTDFGSPQSSVRFIITQTGALSAGYPAFFVG
jgi:hypothetical protein